MTIYTPAGCSNHRDTGRQEVNKVIFTVNLTHFLYTSRISNAESALCDDEETKIEFVSLVKKK